MLSKKNISGSINSNNNYTQYIKDLQKTYLFKDIKEEEILHLLTCIKPNIRKYEKGESILNASDYTRSIGIVLKGKAHIIGEDYFGRKIIFSELKEKDIFAEVYAILAKELQVSIVAVSNIEVLWLDIRNLTSTCMGACSHHDRILQNLLISISERNLKMTNKITHIAKKSIREKLLAYLSTCSLEAKSSEFEIPFNRQDLADYLIVDRSALSSEIGKLKKEGIIEANKNKFKIISKLY